MESVIINGKLRRTILTKEEMKNITTLKPEVKEKRDAYLKKIKANMNVRHDSDGNMVFKI